jgi:glycosyltransferase involved in cell wall biosynthesis
MLSIAICTFNRAPQLQVLLQNLTEVLAMAECDLEILLIDNNSTDGTAELVDEFAQALPLKYFFEENQGLSFARNRALRETQGSAVWFLDDDTSISPQCLMTYRHALNELTNYDYFGGPIEVDWQDNKPKWLKGRNLVILSGLFGAYSLGDSDTDYQNHIPGPYGANFVLRKRLFTQLDGFDTTLGVKGDHLGRGEESEYFSRALTQGAKGRYLSKAQIKHRFQLERIGIFYLYRYGLAKGTEEVVLEGRDSHTWLNTAFDQLARGIWQLMRARRDNFYQCIVNIGIARGRYVATQSAAQLKQSRFK